MTEGLVLDTRSARFACGLFMRAMTFGGRTDRTTQLLEAPAAPKVLCGQNRLSNGTKPEHCNLTFLEIAVIISLASQGLGLRLGIDDLFVVSAARTYFCQFISKRETQDLLCTVEDDGKGIHVVLFAALSILAEN